jgi:hypothetical protein
MSCAAIFSALPLVGTVILLASTTPEVAVAQARDPVARLADAKTVRCEFPVMASGDWKDGVPQGAIKPATLSLRFETVDIEGGTARAVGLFGPSDVNVRLTSNSLHFMQSFREGPLYLTTIIARPSRDGRWPAVHTRHEYTDVSLPGYTSRPEQYYGSCAVEP